MSLFFLDCLKIPFWSVLSLNCCLLSKIYTSYIISKCRSVKMRNIPWFFGAAFLSLVSPELWALKVGLTFQKNLCYLLDWKPFKIDGKRSFCSQDIKVFVTTFWLCRKNCSTRKIRITSKFMTSQPGLQTVAILILPNISQSNNEIWSVNRI